MHDVWTRLERHFAAQQWPVALRPGASVDDLTRVEEATGTILPSAVRASWCIHHDGDEANTPFPWLFDDMRLLSLDAILARWTEQQSYYARWGEDKYVNDTQDAGRIRNLIFHPQRIPIAANEGVCGLWLDFTPGPQGTAGQIIFDLTECEFIALAPDFHTFLFRYAELLETGVFCYEADVYQQIILQHQPPDMIAMLYSFYHNLFS